MNPFKLIGGMFSDPRHFAKAWAFIAPVLASWLISAGVDDANAAVWIQSLGGLLGWFLGTAVPNSAPKLQSGSSATVKAPWLICILALLLALTVAGCGTGGVTKTVFASTEGGRAVVRLSKAVSTECVARARVSSDPVPKLARCEAQRISRAKTLVTVSDYSAAISAGVAAMTPACRDNPTSAECRQLSPAQALAEVQRLMAPIFDQLMAAAVNSADRRALNQLVGR